MRMLALMTDGFGAMGGIAQYNRDLLRALSASDAIEKVVVLARHGTADGVLPAKVAQLSPARGRATFSGRAMKLAATQRFDVVLCGHLFMAPLAALIARMTARPLWLQVHGIEAWARPGRALRYATVRARLVTAVSRYTRRCLLQWSDIAPECVRVLPNTVAAVYTPRQRRSDLVDRYGLAGRRVVLTVGRLSSAERYKGHERMIAALPRVVERHPNVAYLVVGGGGDQARLEASAKATGLGSRVIFTGTVPGADLADYFALGDIFAMPSIGEGFGIVFLEAAAAGLPVIGGDRDGSRDPLADGSIGTMIDPEDIAALADAISSGLAHRLPADARRIERFSFANYARHVDELVHQL